MSLFPRFTQEISPIFRLLDDYERASHRAMRHPDTSIRSFSPKFDVKELKDSYELHGEFPGIEQKDINIEWTDGNTLTVSGRTEHSYEHGERPQGFIEEGDSSHQFHKATVEDEGAEKVQVQKAPKNEVAKDDTPKYWVSERSVGEFHRSFSFPARVDQEKVKASLKSGILTILVPKASPPQARKIPIE